MPKRISWKKGMRLTDEVLKASDDCTSEYISQAMTLAANGRFGLIPTIKPFELQLSITKGFVDVEALSCTAITRGGLLIDVHFDTKFTNTFDGRVQIPKDAEDPELLLCINVDPDEWSDTNEGYQEPDYSFSLVNPKNGLPGYGIPIARIIYEDGWREDNVNFVPPCLTLAAHGKFMQLFQQFVQMLQAIDETAHEQSATAATTALGIFWPSVREQLINVSTGQSTMTPQQFQACVQKVVSAFAIGCELDELVDLEDAEQFRRYSTLPYSFRTAYTRIKQGMSLCYSISQKLEKFGQLKREEPKPVPPPEPVKPTPPPVDSRRRWEGKNI